MLCFILIIVLIFLISLNNRDNFKNCGPSAPNIPPPEWYVPEKLNLSKWATRMYPDRGTLIDNFNSTSYRFWQY